MAKYPPVLEPIITLVNHIDSKTFCEEIIKGNPDKANLTTQTLKERVENNCYAFEEGMF
jgi:hypothetical protein